MFAFSPHCIAPNLLHQKKIGIFVLSLNLELFNQAFS